MRAFTVCFFPYLIFFLVTSMCWAVRWCAIYYSAHSAMIKCYVCLVLTGPIYLAVDFKYIHQWISSAPIQLPMLELCVCVCVLVLSCSIFLFVYFENAFLSTWNQTNVISKRLRLPGADCWSLNKSKIIAFAVFGYNGVFVSADVAAAAAAVHECVFVQ